MDEGHSKQHEINSLCVMFFVTQNSQEDLLIMSYNLPGYWRGSVGVGYTRVTRERRRKLLFVVLSKTLLAGYFAFCNIRYQNANHPIHPLGMHLQALADTRSLHCTAQLPKDGYVPPGWPLQPLSQHSPKWSSSQPLTTQVPSSQ